MLKYRDFCCFLPTPGFILNILYEVLILLALQLYENRRNFLKLPDVLTSLKNHYPQSHWGNRMNDQENSQNPGQEPGEQQSEPQEGFVPEPEEEEELSFADKMLGVFTEPSAMFGQLAKQGVKTSDWLLPMLILLLVIAASVLLRMNDPAISAQIKEKQLEQIEENFRGMVESGDLTAEQAEEQMNQVEENMARFEGGATQIISVVSIFIGGFIVLFIVAGVYFFFAKVVLKGNGEYQHALTAYGLTAWIGIIQVILATLLSFVVGRMLNDVSVASLSGMDTQTVAGFVLSKVEPFSIWAFIVLGIGLAKLFGSDDTKKYVIMVISVWLVWSVIFFGLTQVFPFLKGFGGM